MAADIEAVIANLTDHTMRAHPTRDREVMALIAAYRASEGRVAVLTEALEPFVAGWEGEVAALFASSPPDLRVNGPPDGITVAMMDAACRALAATEQSDGGRREREREDVAIFRDAAMLLACLTDYVEGESISAQVWYQEFFWAIADIQKRVAEIEPDYTDAALMILRRANERYPYRMRHQAAAPDGAGMPESGASGEDGD